MKRLIILATIVACCSAICVGQYRPRTGLRGSPLKIVQLTDPKLKGEVSLEEALAKRRSVRQFTGEPLKLSEIGQLAWAGQGITERQKGLRTAPSAGALYPIELYFATTDGLFIYRPQQHGLEEITAQDVRGMLATTTSMQETILRAGCNIILAGSARKLYAQFRDEAKKYMLLEAGHVAQNIQLQAVCLDLGSVTIGGFNAKELSRICKLPKELEPIYIISVGRTAAPGTPEATEQQKPLAQTPTALTKKVVLIAASENYQDEELFTTQRALEGAGVQTTIASTRLGPIRGMLGGTIDARILLTQLRVDDYDAIIFIGGSGAALEYFDNLVALNIAREAAQKRKVLAAISIAPSVLANAGVLVGTRATSYLSERARLVNAGAIYTGAPVEKDRFIITATNPLAAALFSQAILDALAGR